MKTSNAGRATEITRDIREYGPETHRIAGRQIRPPQTGAVLPQMQMQKGKTTITGRPKAPTVKARPAHFGGSMRLMFDTEFRHPGDEDPFGGRTIEIDPLFTGAMLKLRCPLPLPPR